ncbi:MAG: efflux RND transporter periplasmic adaptor subunit [Ignavibacteriales bacterium]|nr:efflux RND transporter periplasmic adaptor subunit [Ignavibacteriales bacterium]
MKTIHWLIALISVVGLAACDKETTEQQYETMVVKRRTLSSTVLATGVIKPKVGAEVRVGSRVSGIVKKLNVYVGDIVKKGDLLARLDDIELTAQYNQVAANLENAKTAMKYARIEKERQEVLLAESVTPRQMYDRAVKDYEMTQAQVAQVTANLDYAKIQLDYTKIIAPINGVVASVSTQEGETVAAMFAAPTFLTIIDLKRLEIRAYVDETDISKVTEGQQAEFTVDTYPSITFEGIVKAIYPKAEIIDNVVNYVVIIDIVDRKGKILRPEMTTTVNILNESLEGVIAIPNKALTHKNGEDFVYVLKDGKPEERKVAAGVKNKSLTQIISGLAENETLIVNK